MFIPILFAVENCDQFQQQNIQSVLALFSTFFAAGGVVTAAINKIFDAKRIGQIMQLEGKIEGLQWKLTHTEDELLEAKKEGEELKNQIDALREKNDSNVNTQLIDLQEKHKDLMISYKKAVRIINKLNDKKGQT